jgi:hypothetical protein
MSEQHDPTARRSHFLPILLASMGLFFFLLVMVLLTGGFVFYIVLCVMAAVSFGSLHWLLWGKLLTDLTAGEREEERLLQRARGEESEPDYRVYRR